MSRLRADSLGKSYRSRQVVADLSVQVDSGEVVGLLGPNGAGKTTAFNLVTGVYQPSAGRILFNGETTTRALNDYLAVGGVVLATVFGDAHDGTFKAHSMSFSSDPYVPGASNVVVVGKISQVNPALGTLRLGKLTGPRLKKMFAKDTLSLIDELIAEEEVGMIDDDEFISEEMQRGIDMEPLAIQEYCNITGHDVDHPCLIQSEDWTILVQSPDGYIGTEGAVEIKCPKTKNHIKYIRQGKIPNEYRAADRGAGPRDEERDYPKDRGHDAAEDGAPFHG